jgi:hypothetical protein
MKQKNTLKPSEKILSIEAIRPLNLIRAGLSLPLESTRS